MAKNAEENNIESGLTSEEAKNRLSQYGFNEIEEKRKNPLKEFLKRFWGITPWMLEITIIFSFLIHNMIDVYIIAALLIVNAIIGYSQEEKASKAVELLKKSLQINSKVLRDRKWSQIAAKYIVPGDIVRIRAGDFVPADIILITGEEIEIDQSALTGESLPVVKKYGDTVYSGSVVRKGEGNGKVTATGKRTYFGKTTELVTVARPKLHMEEVTTKIVNYLLMIVLVLLSIMVFIAYLRGISLLSVIPVSLMLIVFAVPVALPAMFTVSMAIGSIETARKGALVTRLNAIEDAATMDILCADKTGTLTKNMLSVSEILPMNGFIEENVILYGILASEEADNDPIDIALIKYAKEKRVSKDGIKVEEYRGFDPATRRTEAIVVINGDRHTVVKGAVDTIAKLCNTENAEEIKEKEKMIAQHGHRIIAVAFSKNNKLELCGLIGLSDPPREDTAESIKELKNLGISIKMLTGDAEPIAREIAENVGLGKKVLSGSILKELKIKDPVRAANLAEESDVFAEIYPEDKYTIVRGLQAKEHVVGMTGDGINDAPALKTAEVGIAVSNATDVAKGAASVILTSEGLKNIVDLVKTGRTTYQRIVTWVLNKIVKTFQVSVFLVVGFLVTGNFLLSALDIVLFLFLIDFVTISLSTDSMRGSLNPERWDIRNLVKLGVAMGTIQVLEMFLLLFIGLHYLGLGHNVGVMNTLFFAEIMLYGLLTPLIVRENDFFWKSKPGKTLSISIIMDIIVISLLSLIGFGIVSKITMLDYIVLLSYGIIMNLGINDIFKVMLKNAGLSR